MNVNNKSVHESMLHEDWILCFGDIPGNSNPLKHTNMYEKMSLALSDCSSTRSLVGAIVLIDPYK